MKIPLEWKKALAFVQMRYDDPNGDYGRQERQRLVITALLKKSISYKTILNRSFLNSLSDSSQTDLSMSDMITLARKYSGAREHIVQDHAEGNSDNEGGVSFQNVNHDERQRISNLVQKKPKLEL